MLAIIYYMNYEGLRYQSHVTEYDGLDEFEAKCFDLARDALDCDTGFKLLEIALHDEVDYNGFDIIQHGVGVLVSTYN